MTRSTVLVADDDAAVRRFIVDSLSDGYTVIEAANGTEALGHAEARPRLLIVDLVMPPAGGMELAEQLRARVPGLTVLHISGYAPRPEFNDDERAELLSKPFTAVQLRKHVEWLLREQPPA